MPHFLEHDVSGVDAEIDLVLLGLNRLCVCLHECVHSQQPVAQWVTNDTETAPYNHTWRFIINDLGVIKRKEEGNADSDTDTHSEQRTQDTYVDSLRKNGSISILLLQQEPFTSEKQTFVEGDFQE